MVESNNLDEDISSRGAWQHIIRGMWRSPLGIAGVILITISATLMALGLVAEIFQLTDNVYVPILAFMVLPGGLVTGVLLLPLSAYLRRRQYYKHGISKDHLQVDLSDHQHRKMMVWFTVLTVLLFSLLAVIGYEGYHFADSAYFCGEVCHNVMGPEYTAYKRSPHAKVACVECHIGPGVTSFVKAKLNGLRQVVGVATGSYSRPISSPVAEMRPAEETCEECHNPEKWMGDKVKVFKHFSNDEQLEPEIAKINLHLGGLNPETDAMEGIHWHMSKGLKIEFLSTNERRSITEVKIHRPDGTEDTYVSAGEASEGEEGAEAEEAEWRTMDCLDCHNRPTHIYDLQDQVVDRGLLNKSLNPEIEGIREDALSVITAEYNTREEAKGMITRDLIKLVTARHGEAFVSTNEADIRKAGEYLVKSYEENIWPEMNIKWGTYGLHLGHMRSEEGWGCFRCHDEEHETTDGKVISQGDCALCHDEPE